jgi:peptide/nickel transport system substrate-binding protein
MSRIKMLLILSLLCGFLGLYAGQSAVADEDAVVVVSPWKAKGLDPTVSGFAFTRMGCLETLVVSDRKGGVEPRLATSWSTSEDRLTWTIHLRPKVLFHDDSPLTADVVVASLERARAKGVLGKTPVEHVRAVGDLVVEVQTSRPFAPLPAYLAHYSTAIVAPSSFDESGEAVAVVGTGFYTLADFGQGTDMLFETWQSYWGEPPAISKARYVAVPDPETRALMAEGGDADIALTLSATAAERLRSLDGVTVHSDAIPRVRLLMLNCNLPFFDTVEERRALSLAINRQAIAKGLLKNPATAGVQLLPPLSSTWHVDTLEPLTYDPAEARRLLESQGWSIGPDGIYAMDGLRFSVQLLTYSSRPMLPVVSEAIQAQAKEAGIEAEIFVGEADAVSSANQDGTLKMALLGRNFGLVPDAIGTIATDFGANRSAWGALGWSSTKASGLIEDYEAEFDPDKARAIAREIVRIIHNELPEIPVSWYDHHVAVNNRIAGVKLDPYELRPYPEGAAWSK